jgi:hypothetical protein
MNAASSSTAATTTRRVFMTYFPTRIIYESMIDDLDIDRSIGSSDQHRLIEPSIDSLVHSFDDSIDDPMIQE